MQGIVRAVFIVLFRQGIHCFIWSYQHSQSSKLSFVYMEFDTWFAISMKILEPIICTKLLILTYKSIFCLLIYNIWYGGNFFSCAVIECPILQNPTDGRVIFNDYIPGQLASYECDRGFGLRGNARRQCTQTGMWTGSDPTCESMHNFHTHSPNLSILVLWL